MTILYCKLQDSIPDPSLLPPEQQQPLDDLILARNARHRWDSLPKPLLVRVCERFWRNADPPIRTVEMAKEESSLSTGKLAEVLRVSTLQLPWGRTAKTVYVLKDRVLEVVDDARKAAKRQQKEAKKKARSGRKAKRTVLGSTEMKEITKDIPRTILPSWLPSAPRLIGSTMHGKLSADQWRTACTVHFPITLIRHWGDKEVTSRPFRILDNFLDLITVTVNASRRSTTPDRRKTIRGFMLKYLIGVRDLFPQAPIKPNHHLTLHLPEFLKNFGPPHLWWAYAFERMNGVLQKIPTNHRFCMLTAFRLNSTRLTFSHVDDMERTMTRHFHRATKLRALIRYRLLPESLDKFYGLLSPLLRTQYRGTLATEARAMGTPLWTVLLPPERSLRQRIRGELPQYGRKEAAAFKTSTGVSIQEATVCKALFNRAATYEAIPEHHREEWEKGKNSYIEYRKKDGKVVAGRILRILSTARKSDVSADNTLIVVERLNELNEAAKRSDPYLKWPQLGGRLTYSDYAEDLDVIGPSNIIAHVARCPYDPPASQDFGKACIVIWPLDRVRDCIHASQRLHSLNGTFDSSRRIGWSAIMGMTTSGELDIV